MNLSLTDELNFRKWFGAMSQAKGLSQDPDDPEHFYDYRAYWNSAGQPDQSYPDGHFTSEFKKIGHPRAFLGGVDTVHDYGLGQNLADLIDPQNLARGTRGR